MDENDHNALLTDPSDDEDIPNTSLQNLHPEPSTDSLGQLRSDQENTPLIDQKPSTVSTDSLIAEPPPCLTWVQKVMYGLPQFNANFGNALLNVQFPDIFVILILISYFDFEILFVESNFFNFDF